MYISCMYIEMLPTSTAGKSEQYSEQGSSVRRTEIHLLAVSCERRACITLYRGGWGAEGHKQPVARRDFDDF